MSVLHSFLRVLKTLEKSCGYMSRPFFRLMARVVFLEAFISPDEAGLKRLSYCSALQFNASALLRLGFFSLLVLWFPARCLLPSYGMVMIYEYPWFVWPGV